MAASLACGGAPPPPQRPHPPRAPNVSRSGGPPPTPVRSKQAADSPVPQPAVPSPDPAASPLPRPTASMACVRVRTIQRAYATAVSHQVGHGRAAMLCFKCFWMLFRHVASPCFKYFSCFRCMFQLFQADISKVDWDVAYVAMVVHVCCKRLSPLFHLLFVHAYFKCFRRMSQVFYLSSFVCCKCCIWMF